MKLVVTQQGTLAKVQVSFGGSLLPPGLSSYAAVDGNGALDYPLSLTTGTLTLTSAAANLTGVGRDININRAVSQRSASISSRCLRTQEHRKE